VGYGSETLIVSVNELVHPLSVYDTVNAVDVNKESATTNCPPVVSSTDDGAHVIEQEAQLIPFSATVLPTPTQDAEGVNPAIG
jgi:hypothetical protein